jgi:hypothetical protein
MISPSWGLVVMRALALVGVGRRRSGGARDMLRNVEVTQRFVPVRSG